MGCVITGQLSRSCTLHASVSGPKNTQWQKIRMFHIFFFHISFRDIMRFIRSRWTMWTLNINTIIMDKLKNWFEHDCAQGAEKHIYMLFINAKIILFSPNKHARSTFLPLCSSSKSRCVCDCKTKAGYTWICQGACVSCSYSGHSLHSHILKTLVTKCKFPQTHWLYRSSLKLRKVSIRSRLQQVVVGSFLLELTRLLWRTLQWKIQ